MRQRKGLWADVYSVVTLLSTQKRRLEFLSLLKDIHRVVSIPHLSCTTFLTERLEAKKRWYGYCHL